LRTRQRLALASLAAAVVLAAACTGDAKVTSSKIFEAAPWQGAEELTYRVTNRGIDGAGTCRFVTPPQQSGPAEFVQHCSKDEFGDERLVVADAATLVPVRTLRTNTDSKKGTSVTHTITYERTEATFVTNDGQKSRTTTRPLPKPSDTSPDPGWYDDDTLFWLARGVPRREGWTGGYTHVINAGQPRVLDVSVEVQKPEAVQVPAGAFQGWRVRFQRADTVYVLWVDAESPHRVVRAQIEDVRYELSAVK
jgi:Protein of unknown function (DUF3108)